MAMPYYYESGLETSLKNPGRVFRAFFLNKQEIHWEGGGADKGKHCLLVVRPHTRES
jgi:hypothetical protein